MAGGIDDDDINSDPTSALRSPPLPAYARRQGFTRSFFDNNNNLSTFRVLDLGSERREMKLERERNLRRLAQAERREEDAKRELERVGRLRETAMADLRRKREAEREARRTMALAALRLQHWWRRVLKRRRKGGEKPGIVSDVVVEVLHEPLPPPSRTPTPPPTPPPTPVPVPSQAVKEHAASSITRFFQSIKPISEAKQEAQQRRDHLAAERARVLALMGEEDGTDDEDSDDGA